MTPWASWSGSTARRTHANIRCSFAHISTSLRPVSPGRVCRGAGFGLTLSSPLIVLMPHHPLQNGLRGEVRLVLLWSWHALNPAPAPDAPIVPGFPSPLCSPPRTGSSPSFWRAHPTSLIWSDPVNSCESVGLFLFLSLFLPFIEDRASSSRGRF